MNSYRTMPESPPQSIASPLVRTQVSVSPVSKLANSAPVPLRKSRICMFTCMLMCMFVCVHVCINVFVRLCVYICVYVHIFLCACVVL
jgi:hypothetical protein